MKSSSSATFQLHFLTKVVSIKQNLHTESVDCEIPCFIDFLNKKTRQSYDGFYEKNEANVEIQLRVNAIMLSFFLAGAFINILTLANK